ncbi:MAG: hypothetical protein R3203_00025 [Pseudoalteromonas tetraodonis]|nr:hypothetical protein [Pseudoalteromonas tetraodonis]
MFKDCEKEIITVKPSQLIIGFTAEDAFNFSQELAFLIKDFDQINAIKCHDFIYPFVVKSEYNDSFYVIANWLPMLFENFKKQETVEVILCKDFDILHDLSWQYALHLFIQSLDIETALGSLEELINLLPA